MGVATHLVNHWLSVSGGETEASPRLDDGGRWVANDDGRQSSLQALATERPDNTEHSVQRAVHECQQSTERPDNTKHSVQRAVHECQQSTEHTDNTEHSVQRAVQERQQSTERPDNTEHSVQRAVQESTVNRTHRQHRTQRTTGCT